jgi:hypothetical protein
VDINRKILARLIDVVCFLGKHLITKRWRRERLTTRVTDGADRLVVASHESRVITFLFLSYIIYFYIILIMEAFNIKFVCEIEIEIEISSSLTHSLMLVFF